MKLVATSFIAEVKRRSFSKACLLFDIQGHVTVLGIQIDYKSSFKPPNHT
jgi:hypothetical protein